MSKQPVLGPGAEAIALSCPRVHSMMLRRQSLRQSREVDTRKLERQTCGWKVRVPLSWQSLLASIRSDIAGLFTYGAGCFNTGDGMKEGTNMSTRVDER